MTETTLVPGNERALSALDPRLSFLASQAAVELDKLLLGKGEKIEAVQHLGTRLQESMGGQSDTSEQRMFLDSPTVSVLTETISQGSFVLVQREMEFLCWRVSEL
ncbi:MAG: hypothetical protein JW809_15995 [Pirellulales bacterium]|nr:hypothetical protein [Pirellulales bacterium]